MLAVDTTEAGFSFAPLRGRGVLRAYRVAPAFLLGVRACGAPFPRCVVGRCRAKPGTAVNFERLSGDGRSRTDIFLVASEALVQLSYIPLCPSHRFAFLLGHAEHVALGVASARGWCVAGHNRQRGEYSNADGWSRTTTARGHRVTAC